VDLIVAQPALRAALAPALLLGPDEVGQMEVRLAGSIMDSVRSVLENPSIKVGIIVDEVQAITFAIRDGMADKALEVERIAASYFQDWHNWDNRNRVFVRMDIASSHGARELTLPSGEDHRLRIVTPWAADLVAAATTEAGSPCAFIKAHDAARQRIVFTAGGIPRSLFRGKKLLEEALPTYDTLPPSSKTRAVSKLLWATNSVVHSLKLAMTENCARWFQSLTAVDKASASRDMLPLVRGELTWDRVKSLCDDGLVARDQATSTARPVSAVAASVIMAELAGHYNDHVRKPLRTVEAGAQRGYELEMQVIARLASDGHKSLPAKTLKGSLKCPPTLTSGLLSTWLGTCRRTKRSRDCMSPHPRCLPATSSPSRPQLHLRPSPSWCGRQASPTHGMPSASTNCSSGSKRVAS